LDSSRLAHDESRFDHRSKVSALESPRHGSGRVNQAERRKVRRRIQELILADAALERIGAGVHTRWTRIEGAQAAAAGREARDGENTPSDPCPHRAPPLVATRDSTRRSTRVISSPSPPKSSGACSLKKVRTVISSFASLTSIARSRTCTPNRLTI